MRVLFSRKLAFVAKPRCASTSVRRFLTKHIDQNAEDFGIDVAGERKYFHPHMTAPYIRDLLSKYYSEKASALEYFIVIRRPYEMLESYYKYFQPDENSNYNYSPNYSSGRMLFEDWIMNGKVGTNPEWHRRGPKWISCTNLTPLTLEAHICNTENQPTVKNIFLIEEKAKLERFLSDKFSINVNLPHINQSSNQICIDRALSNEAKSRVKMLFPLESSIYNL